MELILLPEAAENEIGDLAEEYCAKARRDGLQNARRWFWFQVISTLSISIREDMTVRLLLGRAIRQCCGQAWGLSVLVNRSWTARSSLIAFANASFALFCLLSLEEQLAQRRTASSQEMQTYESSLPQRDVRSNEGNLHHKAVRSNESSLSHRVAPSNESSLRRRVSPSDESSFSQRVAPAESAPAESYSATAFAFRWRTASGRPGGKGIIAADTSVLPIGTRVRLEAGTWSGDYTVADTGGALSGRKIDVWVPTTDEAFRFGRRKVKLTVLSYGGRRNKNVARA